MKTALMLLRRYVLNVLLGIDQLGNSLMGGSPDETISSVLGKCHRGDYGFLAGLITAPFRLLVDGFFYLLGDPNHCHRSIEDDEGEESIWQMILKTKFGESVHAYIQSFFR